MDFAYGTPEHEAWLIEMEREDDRWGPEPVPSTIPFYDGPGCACTVRVVYGGDCEHTVERDETPESGSWSSDWANANAD
jgi:hypothetical protein